MIIVSIYALFIGYKYIKPNIKTSLFRTIVILLGLCVFFFFLVEFLTFKPRPNGTVSGNGNPVIIILVVLVPVFLTLLYFWVKGLYKGFIQQSEVLKKKHLFYGLLLLVIGIVLQVIYVVNKVSALENHPYNPFKADYHGSIINQYTNNLFFNGSIYGILITGTLVGTLLTLKYKKKESKTNIQAT